MITLVKEYIEVFIKGLKTYEHNAKEVKVKASCINSKHFTEATAPLKLNKSGLFYEQSSPIRLEVLLNEDYIYTATVINKEGKESSPVIIQNKNGLYLPAPTFDSDDLTVFPHMIEAVVSGTPKAIKYDWIYINGESMTSLPDRNTLPTHETKENKITIPGKFTIANNSRFWVRAVYSNNSFSDWYPNNTSGIFTTTTSSLDADTVKGKTVGTSVPSDVGFLTNSEKTNLSSNKTINGNNSLYHTGNKPTKADVGLSNVENKSSATIRGEIVETDIPTLPESKISGLTNKIQNINNLGNFVSGKVADFTIDNSKLGTTGYSEFTKKINTTTGCETKCSLFSDTTNEIAGLFVKKSFPSEAKTPIYFGGIRASADTVTSGLGAIAFFTGYDSFSTCPSDDLLYNSEIENMTSYVLFNGNSKFKNISASDVTVYAINKDAIQTVSISISTSNDVASIEIDVKDYNNTIYTAQNQRFVFDAWVSSSEYGNPSDTEIDSSITVGNFLHGVFGDSYNNIVKLQSDYDTNGQKVKFTISNIDTADITLYLMVEINNKVYSSGAFTITSATS